MDIFIGWSGAASLVMAKGLREWLPRVIQASRPFLSSEDISKGRRWNAELSAQLAKTNFAILCLTPENLSSNWIHFEAGAVSKKPGDSHVSALLLNVKASDLVDPLAQFQHALPTKEDVWKLVTSVNAAIEPDRQTHASVREWSFNQAWPDFEKLVANAQEALKHAAAPAPQRRKPEDVLEELVTLVRDLHRDRAESGPLGRFAQVLTPEQEASVLSKAFRPLTTRLSLLDSVSETPLTLRSPPADLKK